MNERDLHKLIMSYFPLMPGRWQRDSADLINEARFYHISPVIPPSHPFQSARGPPQLNPWRRADDTMLAGFFSIDGEIHGFRQEPRLVYFNDERSEMEGIGRSSQWASPFPTIQFQEDSKLTREQQEKALKKLKKEVYNPVPKTITRRISLYYRDKNPNPGSIKEKEKEIEEDGKRCAVCLDDFEPKEEVTLTPCKHMFHEDCIAPWVRSHGLCPVCRFSLCDQIGQRPSTVDYFPADAVPTRDIFPISPFYLEEDYALQNLSRRFSS